MAPSLPARCTSCGHQFQPASSAIYIEGDHDKVTVAGNTVSCPQCGRPAQIVDGVMNVRDGAIQMVSGPQWSWDLIEHLRLGLRQIVEDPPADPAAAVAALSPELGQQFAATTTGWTRDQKLTLISIIVGVLSLSASAAAQAPAIAGVMMEVYRILALASVNGYDWLIAQR